jgi:PEP-CTERM motif
MLANESSTCGDVSGDSDHGDWRSIDNGKGHADVKNRDGGEASVRRDRRAGHHPWQGRSKWLALLLFAAATVVTWQFARQQPSSTPSRSLAGKAEDGLLRSRSGDYATQPRQPSPMEPARGVGRLVYPYSVVRGGVANPGELRRAMEYDPVVSRHFQGFDYQRAHVVQLSEKQAMYVSYRIGNAVYWTRRKVTLLPGEKLITDGTIVARARCGNRVAAVPMDTGSPLEPSTDEFEQPFVLRDPDPTPPVLVTESSAPGKLPPNVVPVKGSGWWFIPPLVYVPSGSSGSSGGPLAVTPEPGSLLLISSGLAAVYWRSRKNRGKK